MKAAPSDRASGHVTLSFGVVAIPVSLFSGTVSDHGITRKEYLPVEVDGKVEDHPVGRGQIDKVDGHLLTDAEKMRVVKKIETEYGPVYVEDHEIEQLFTLTPDELKITEFQPQHLFYQGNYVPKGLMFVEPSKDKTKKKAYIPAATKVLTALLKGMREEGVVAVGELTTRGVPKPCILTPDGAVWLVYHTDAIREQREWPEAELNEAEIGMMRSLIGTLKKTEPADLTDFRSELIQNFAEEKAKAGDFGASVDTYVATAPTEPAVDLMSMLQASIEAAKKAS